MHSIMKNFLIICFMNGIRTMKMPMDEDRAFLLEHDIKNYCEIPCPDGINGTHTLCQIHRPKNKNFTFEKIEGQVYEDIMYGHNGVRNRIAKRMKASAMNKLTYNKELARMAQIWIEERKTYENDPCTQYNVKNDFTQHRYKYVAQNVAFIESAFYPPSLIPSILRDWYYEKNSMTPPEYYEDGLNKIGNFTNEVNNNFTRLAYPPMSRIGCAFARYSKGFALVCNYYPYQILTKFRSGPPASSCPNRFPLKDLLFESLCTKDSKAVNFKGFETINIIIYLIVTISLF